LTITLAPEFGDAGMYQYTFMATDEYNASETITLSVEVGHTNRAPVFVGPAEPLMFYSSSQMKEYTLSEFFMDPDNDAMNFTVTSLDEQVAEVFSSSSGFLVRPAAIGETSLRFVVTDINGGVLEYDLPVMVSVV